MAEHVWRPSIPVVRDRGGRRWTPEQVERDPALVDRDGLQCADCGVDATWQAAHTRIHSRTGLTFDVRLHFRLRHRGSEHAPTCRYDFDRRAGDLTHDFPGIVTKRGEVYQLRMPLSAMPQAHDPRPGVRQLAPHLEAGAGPVLSAARRIVQLLEDFSGQPGAQERFRARYADLEEIGWGDFCWHVNRNARACELVDELRRPERRTYPIAVWGMARPVKASRSGSSRYVTLTHVRQGQTAARIRARDPLVLQPFEVAQQAGVARRVIGFGEWRAALLDERRHGATRADDHETAVEAVLWANHPSAVAWW